MGRWPYSNRRTVEKSKAITTKFLKKNNYFTGGTQRGEITWSFNGEKTGSIGIIVSTGKGSEYIRFQYVQIDQETKEATRMGYKVQLTSTQTPASHNIKWWFICPQVVNGHACGKRVGSLYLEEKHFGCRHCYNLTYTSSQESHKFDRLFWDIGFTIQEARLAFPGV